MLKHINENEFDENVESGFNEKKINSWKLENELYNNRGRSFCK